MIWSIRTMMPARPEPGSTRSARGARACVALLALATMLTAGLASGASSSTTIGATEPSAARIDAAGCASGTPGVTDFGVVMPSTKAVTGTDCTVKFGASNDTAMLRLYQAEGGNGMTALADGSLDTAGWGAPNGYSSIDLGGEEFAEALTTLPDGRVYVAGDRAGDLVVARLTAAGALDTTFNSPNGYVTTALDPSSGLDIVVQPDGKVLVAGTRGIIRYTSSGVLDTTFNAPLGAVSVTWTMERVALQPDGRIVVAGTTVGSADARLARYTADGLLDTTFNAPNGFIDYNSGGATDMWTALELTPSGSIVVAGRATGSLVVARYTSAGVADSGFSAPDGIDVRVLGGGFHRIHDLAIQPDGKVIVVGKHWGAVDYEMLVARYTSTGALDTATFAAPDGFASLSVLGGEDEARQVELVGDRIHVVGLSFGSGSLTMARFLPNGSLDTTFGAPNGYVNLPWIGALANYPNAMDVRDGALYVTAHHDGGPTHDLLVVKWGAPKVDDYVDDGSADWDTAGSIDLFAACLRSTGDGAFSGGTAWTPGPPTTCPAADRAYGHAVPSASPRANVAYTTAPDVAGGATDPYANLRFGFRTRSDQPAGLYVAPLTFDVIAPNSP